MKMIINGKPADSVSGMTREDLQQIAGLLSGQHTDPEQGNG